MSWSQLWQFKSRLCETANKSQKQPSSARHPLLHTKNLSLIALFQNFTLGVGKWGYFWICIFYIYLDYFILTFVQFKNIFPCCSGKILRKYLLIPPPWCGKTHEDKERLSLCGKEKAGGMTCGRSDCRVVRRRQPINLRWVTTQFCSEGTQSLAPSHFGHRDFKNTSSTDWRGVMSVRGEDDD